MPHVIIKLWTGKSERQKARIADEVTKAIMTSTGYGAESVSVAIEDVEPNQWTEKVYKPDILGHQAQLYKKPGYRPL
jgi:4-oxalocrotonate tautomerase